MKGNKNDSFFKKIQNELLRQISESFNANKKNKNILRNLKIIVFSISIVFVTIALTVTVYIILNPEKYRDPIIVKVAVITLLSTMVGLPIAIFKFIMKSESIYNVTPNITPGIDENTIIMYEDSKQENNEVEMDVGPAPQIKELFENTVRDTFKKLGSKSKPKNENPPKDGT
jgi:hypothetical protein